MMGVHGGLAGLVGLVACAACGGKVEEPASGAAASVPTATARAPLVGCEAACDRLRVCAPASGDPGDCVASCRKEFSSADRARVYGECIEAIPCTELPRAISMGYGPIGACYSKVKDR